MDIPWLCAWWCTCKSTQHKSNAGDLREMQGEMGRAKAATAALLSVGADAKAQGDATSTLCDKLGKEVDSLAKQLGAKN